MADCWGEEYNKKLPKTMTIELNRKQTWALGKEATLDTIGENEAVKVDKDSIPKVIKLGDVETEEALEERGATGGVPTSNSNENNESQNKQITESTENSSTEDSSDDESANDRSEAGKARIQRNKNINEWVTDRAVDDILCRVQLAAQANKNRSNEIAGTIGEALNNAQRGMDQAFIAGALASHAGVARKDSLEYSRQVPQKVRIEAAVKAKTYLKEAKKKVKILAEEEFEKLRLLVAPDEDIFILASDLLKNIKTIAKQSIKLAEDVTKHPGSLGAVQKTQVAPKYPDLRENMSRSEKKYLKTTPKSDDIFVGSRRREPFVAECTTRIRICWIQISSFLQWLSNIIKHGTSKYQICLWH